jgi:hypothetical protein
MRTLSTLLVLCVAYTLAHESLHHHGTAEVLFSVLPHTESHAHHHEHERDHHPHDHPTPQTDHENENHDGQTHDHKFSALVFQKSLSTDKLRRPQQAGDSPYLTPADTLCWTHPPILSHPTSFHEKASFPEEMRAPILRL